MAAALLAAALYGVAPALQALPAREEPAGRGFGALLTLRLAGRPLWLLGLAFEIGAFALEAYAFSAAPATLVAPLTACELVFFVPAVRWLLDERPGRLFLAGVLATSAGIVLLGLAFGGSAQLGDVASEPEMLAFLASGVAVAALAAGIGSRLTNSGRTVAAAALFSAAAGVAYGFAALATRQIGRAFAPGDPWHLLATATPYTLVVCSLLGIGMMQRGLQASALLTFPLTSAISALLPVIVSATLLGDPVPGGLARAGFVAALVLVIGGAIVLGRDRARSAVEL
jgi:drug/metabolite transporter (DMT)-like permease